MNKYIVAAIAIPALLNAIFWIFEMLVEFVRRSVARRNASR